MQVLVINNDGGGFADYIDIPEGTNVKTLFTQQIGSADPSNENPDGDWADLPYIKRMDYHLDGLGNPCDACADDPGNDADADRHGIVTKGAGLMNPNHYLAVAIHYLFQNRPAWRPDAAVGKT